MRKILDRYVSGYFFSAQAVFLSTLVSLFLLIDFVTKIRLFFSLERSLLPFLARYYAYRIPAILQYALPLVLLLSAVFAFMRLARSNEIVPIVCAGRSLRRLSLPFFLTALLTGGVMFVLDEHVLPRLSEELADMDAELAAGQHSWDVFAHDEHGHRLIARLYDHVAQKMEEIRLLRFEGTNIRRFSLEAKRGYWDDRTRRWTFFDGTLQEFDKLGNEIVQERPGQRPLVVKNPIPPEGYSPDLDIAPVDLQRRFFLSASWETFRELRRKIERQPHVPTARMRLQSKYALPFSPILLLLIGLPSAVFPGRRGMIRGLALSLLICGLYYATHFAGVDLGNRGAVPPEIAAWVPTALFGSIGAVLFARMST